MVGQHNLKSLVHLPWCISDAQRQPSNAFEARILVRAVRLDIFDGIKVTTLQNEVVKVMFTLIVNLRVIESTPVLLLFLVTGHVGPELGSHIGQRLSFDFNIDESIL